MNWLAEHPRWSFQFTPTHASWLNQVEIFFSILARRLLKHGAFTSEQNLAEQSHGDDQNPAAKDVWSSGSALIHESALADDTRERPFLGRRA